VQNFDLAKGMRINFHSFPPLFYPSSPTHGDKRGSRTKKRKPRGLPFPVLFFKKDQRNRPHDHFNLSSPSACACLAAAAHPLRTDASAPFCWVVTNPFTYTRTLASSVSLSAISPMARYISAFSCNAVIILTLFISRCKFRNYFSDLQIFGRKTPSGGRVSGGKEERGKGHEKTEAARTSVSWFYSLKKIRGTDPMITGKKSLAEFLVHDVLP